MKQTKKNIIARIVVKWLLFSLSILFLASCRLLITTDETGYIISGSGSADCAQASCEISISDIYTETFTAVAAQGYRFVKWDGICAPAPTKVCEVKLSSLPEAYSELSGDAELSAVFESSAFKRAWYQDSDGDSYGAPHTSMMAFEQPDGFVVNKTDCDDFRGSVSPLAKEMPDWFDNDCDGLVDERDTYYRDVDGDFFGSSDETIESFETVSGYTLLDGDCNDNDSNIFPFAKEKLDSVDNNCDGSVDEGFNVAIVRPLLPVAKAANPTIGPLPVLPTDLADGTRFASVAGGGSVCSAATPCSARSAIEGARAGDVVFLRGGIYQLDRHLFLSAEGGPGQLITVESYPGELAVFDGSNHPSRTNIQLVISGSYYAFRRMEVRIMPMHEGLRITGHHNLIEGIYAHHNNGPGIKVADGGSFNVLRSCTASDNSGVGVFEAWSKNGGNSDGISIQNGDQNRIEHSAAYRNSDDGFDTWQSTNTYVGYSIAAQNGLGDGDGNGFKSGGSAPSRATLVERSLAYQNRGDGFDVNEGVDVSFRYNTAWENGGAGYFTYDSTMTTACIASDNGEASHGGGSFSNNSWQRLDAEQFVSVDPNSASFLVPALDGAMGDIGAFGEQ
jgi:hypothetical protein